MVPVVCNQCGILSVSHRRCRCLVCNQIHARGRPCPVIPVHDLCVLCIQCGMVAAPHVICRCVRCNRQHQHLSPCLPFRERRVAKLRAACTGAIPVVHNIGEMNITCSWCGSRSWHKETINCCASGEIVLPSFPEPPPAVSDAILQLHVRQNIRAYNMSMAMASVGHHNISLPDGMFVLGGKTYNLIGSMLPRPDHPAAFAQIYILDVEQASDRRMNIFANAGLRREVVSNLHTLLSEHNPLIRQFVQAARGTIPELVWKCADDISTMQIGALVERAGCKRDIVIQRLDRLPEFIDDGHALYHPLAYPLLFPLGNAGWHDNLTVSNVEHSRIKRVTLTEWGRYYIMHREHATHWQRCEKLSMEFYCDIWAQVEARNAFFHRSPAQQAKYRAARVAAIEDQISDGVPAAEIGQPVVRLPSSFVGSARYYQQLYMDAMALPKKFGKPDLFITFTCNPKWPEIVAVLPEHAHWQHHGDLIERVFMLKLKSLLKDIVDDEIFGPVRAFVYRIEWQARG